MQDADVGSALVSECPGGHLAWDCRWKNWSANMILRHKAWETVGQSRLLIIGEYRMGFEISPQNGGSNLRVFIDYELPQSRRGRWLSAKLASRYAAWCTQRMVEDAAAHFAAVPASSASLAPR